MNLYLLEQTENTGWDTYNSCVVASESEEDAKTIYPSKYYTFIDGKWYWVRCDGNINFHDCANSEWASTSDNVTATLIGVAITGTERGVILASFNAG